MWDNWRQRKEPRKHQHTASVMRGLRTDCPFPVLPVALQSWEGGGAIETFFADVVPAMDGLQWKTVSKGQWLVPFPQEADHQMACDVANLVTACEKGWKFLSKNVQVSLEPNRPMVQLPRIVTGEPVPDVREGWQRTVRLAVLLRLVACTPLASVGQLAVVPPAMSMDRAQGVPQASTIESFVEAKFLESYPEAEQMSTADLRDWAKDLHVPGVGKRTGRTKLLKDVGAFLQRSMNQN